MFEYSPSQKKFIQQSLASQLRVDGRALHQRRSINIKCNILDNLSGSSFVSVDHGRIEIYTGVKIRICTTNDSSQPQNKVILQLSSMRKLTQQLSKQLQYLQQLLQQHFIDKQKQSFKQLDIPKSRKHYLQLYIETFMLTEPHLSLLESLYISIKNALLSTSIPKLQCFFNEVTKQEAVELTNQTITLKLSEVEHFILVGVIDNLYLVDLTPLEFESLSSVQLITIKNEKIRTIQSLKGSIGSDEIHKICRFALNNAK